MDYDSSNPEIILGGSKHCPGFRGLISFFGFNRISDRNPFVTEKIAKFEKEYLSVSARIMEKRKQINRVLIRPTFSFKNKCRNEIRELFSKSNFNVCSKDESNSRVRNICRKCSQFKTVHSRVECSKKKINDRFISTLNKKTESLDQESMKKLRKVIKTYIYTGSTIAIDLYASMIHFNFFPSLKRMDTDREIFWLIVNVGVLHSKLSYGLLGRFFLKKKLIQFSCPLLSQLADQNIKYRMANPRELVWMDDVRLTDTDVLQYYVEQDGNIFEVSQILHVDYMM